MDSLGAGIKPNGEGFTGIEELKKQATIQAPPKSKGSMKTKGPKKSSKPFSHSS